MKKKTWLSAFIIMLAVSLALVACNGGTNGGKTTQTTVDNTKDDPAPAEKIKFTNGIWPEATDKRLPQFQAWEQQFKTQYPDVDIKSEAFKYEVNSFLPRAASGQLPNLYKTFFTESQKIISAGYAADITEALQEYGYDKAINPDLLTLVQKDGKTYGLPTDGYYMGILYNLNLLKKAGLVNDKGVPNYPQTYEELVTMAKTIKEKTGKAGFFFPTKNGQGGWQFMNIAWSYGAEFIEQKDGKWNAVFNSPQGVEALQLIKDMKWKHDILGPNVLVEVADMFRQFGTDQVGMAFGLAGWRNAPINDYKMKKESISMSRVPAGPAGRISLLGGNIDMFSPESSKDQIKAGLDFLKVTGFDKDATPESLQALDDQLKSQKELGFIIGPREVMVWVNQDRLVAEKAIYDKYINVDINLFNDYMNNEGVTIKPEVAVNAQELYKLLDTVIQTVLTNKNADPQALLDKAAADFQKDYLDKAK